MTAPSLASHTLRAPAKHRLAASSVAPVASGYERSLRPCLALADRTRTAKRHSETSSKSRPRPADGRVVIVALILQPVVLYVAVGVAAVVVLARVLLGWAMDSS
jgi:hypothetical protein